MKVVDILPENLGVVIYPEHDKLKSLVIDEINNHLYQVISIKISESG